MTCEYPFSAKLWRDHHTDHSMQDTTVSMRVLSMSPGSSKHKGFITYLKLVFEWLRSKASFPVLALLCGLHSDRKVRISVARAPSSAISECATLTTLNTWTVSDITENYKGTTKQKQPNRIESTSHRVAMAEAVTQHATIGARRYPTSYCLINDL